MKTMTLGSDIDTWHVINFFFKGPNWSIFSKVRM